MDGNLIVWYINKMGTHGGGGVVDAWRRRGGGWRAAATIASHLVRGLNPNPDANLFFTNICTNSYK